MPHRKRKSAATRGAPVCVSENKDSGISCESAGTGLACEVILVEADVIHVASSVPPSVKYETVKSHKDASLWLESFNINSRESVHAMKLRMLRRFVEEGSFFCSGNDFYVSNRITPAFRDCPAVLGLSLQLHDSVTSTEQDLSEALCSFSIVSRFDRHFSAYGLPPRRSVHLTPDDFPLYFLRHGGSPAGQPSRSPSPVSAPPCKSPTPPSPTWTERCCGLDDAASDSLFWRWALPPKAGVASGPNMDAAKAGNADLDLARSERPDRLAALLCFPGTIELWQPSCPHHSTDGCAPWRACPLCPCNALVRLGTRVVAQLAFSYDDPLPRALHTLALATGLLRLPERAVPFGEAQLELIARTHSDMRNDIIARTAAAYNSDGVLVGFVAGEGECAVDVDADGNVLPAASLMPIPASQRRPSTFGSAWMRTLPANAPSAKPAAASLHTPADPSLLVPHFAGFFSNGFLTFRVLHFFSDAPLLSARVLRAVVGLPAPVVACDDKHPDEGLLQAAKRLETDRCAADPGRGTQAAPSEAPSLGPALAAPAIGSFAGRPLGKIYQPAFDSSLPLFSFVQPDLLPRLVSSPTPSPCPTVAAGACSGCNSPSQGGPPGPRRPAPIELPPKLRRVTWSLLEQVKRALFGASERPEPLESFTEEAAEAAFYRDVDSAQRDYAIRCTLSRLRQIPPPPLPPLLGGDPDSDLEGDGMISCGGPPGSPSSPARPSIGAASLRRPPCCPVPQFTLASVRRVLALARRHYGRPTPQQPAVRPDAAAPAATAGPSRKGARKPKPPPSSATQKELPCRPSLLVSVRCTQPAVPSDVAAASDPENLLPLVLESPSPSRSASPSPPGSPVASEIADACGKADADPNTPDAEASESDSVLSDTDDEDRAVADDDDPPSPPPASALGEDAGGLLVVGDLHGSLASLHRILPLVDRVLRAPEAPLQRQGKVVFLGDFVDRGPHSVEVLMTVLLYRLAFPERVIVLRGNHETERSRELGFEAELRRKYPDAIPAPVLNDKKRDNGDPLRGLAAPLPRPGTPELPPHIEEIVRSVRVRVERSMSLVARFEPLPNPLYARFLRLFNELPLACLAEFSVGDDATAAADALLAQAPGASASSAAAPPKSMAVATPAGALPREGNTPAKRGRVASPPATAPSTEPATRPGTHRVFLCHAGVPPLKRPVVRLDEIAAVPHFDLFGKVQDLPTRCLSRAEMIHRALLWADPGSVDCPNADRMPFSPATLNRFLRTNSLDLVIRAHQADQHGYILSNATRLATVFSVMNYCGTHNAGAVFYVRQGPPVSAMGGRRVLIVSVLQSPRLVDEDDDDNDGSLDAMPAC